MGLKIIQLYLNGVKKEQIAQQLQQQYINCSKEQILKDINEFLVRSKLS